MEKEVDSPCQRMVDRAEWSVCVTPSHGSWDGWSIGGSGQGGQNVSRSGRAEHCHVLLRMVGLVGLGGVACIYLPPPPLLAVECVY
jgi:hypothetical protein